jgi:histidyl-tRNA synthetase
VTAEAELLSAIITLFKRLGITSKDVVIKVNSRQVLQEFLAADVPTAQISYICTIVDKLDKLGNIEVERQLRELGLLFFFHCSCLPLRFG